MLRETPGRFCIVDRTIFIPLISKVWHYDLMIVFKAFASSNSYRHTSLNPMTTTCGLVKRLSYIELIRRGVRKNSIMCKFVCATF